MVAIVYKTGNLLEASEPMLVHGCNAQGKMASGVAGSIRNRFPFAYEAYMNMFHRDRLDLGSVVWAIHKDQPVIGNAITQEHYGYDGQRYVNYGAIVNCIEEIEKFVRSTQSNSTKDGIELEAFGPIRRVAFPLIGTKLGGGKWSAISDIIQQHSLSFIPVVYLLDGTIPD
jgi:O-acetyl-ADP-ribose deacetylase (regulator of RNase III)